MNKKILVIDDEKSLLDTMKLILSKSGYTVMTSSTAMEGLKIIKELDRDISLIITDLALPGGFDGIDILDAVRDLNSDIPVIMITAYGNVETAVKAMQKGAYNFLTKPVNFKVLLQQVTKAIEHASVIQENIRLRNEIKTIRIDRYEMIFVSQSMEKLIETSSELAKTDETVLIIGESGTGKELLARHVLRESNRAGRSFVAFNAAAVNESLMESELFGYKKGAFTGAEKNSPGYIGAAEGGTLFIDEIGDMPLNLQSKLLRFLQSKEYLPVGSAIPVFADVRVIAATNKDLKKEIDKGNFREDLYYRLSVFPLVIPPLRERREDIPVLIRHFVEKLSSQYKKQAVHPDGSIIRDLTRMEWKGNVRELENYIARFILSSGKLPNAPEVSVSQVEEEAPVITFKIGQKTMKELEKEVIAAALRFTDGNKVKAAELLDVSQRTIYRKITEEDI
ncbi:MAG TPA: sigma-54 dependent transcriptional regulator [bacterium]|nr:sigma-54 dependent transcriptional regulator [bacterium]HPS29977.1 sigma-54 dependent transcriptional regulator [bacterium]